MTVVNQTVPVPEKPKKRWDPITIFPSNSKAAQFWFFVSVGLAILAVVQPYFLVQAMRIRERIVILDESGTFHVAPMQDFRETAPMHDYIATVAAQALLNRGPEGADNPPQQKQLFLKDAYNKIGSFYNVDAPHFKEHRIHQKCEIERLKILETTDRQVLADLRGQLIRIGDFQGEKFVNTKNFHLQLRLHRNGNIGANRRLPMAVVKWQIKLSDAKKTATDEKIETKPEPDKGDTP